MVLFGLPCGLVFFMNADIRRSGILLHGIRINLPRKYVLLLVTWFSIVSILLKFFPICSFVIFKSLISSNLIFSIMRIHLSWKTSNFDIKTFVKAQDSQPHNNKLIGIAWCIRNLDCKPTYWDFQKNIKAHIVLFALFILLSISNSSERSKEIHEFKYLKNLVKEINPWSSRKHFLVLKERW